jgi:crossover junction endodeoxyribonuclease RusA
MQMTRARRPSNTWSRNQKAGRTSSGCSTGIATSPHRERVRRSAFWPRAANCSAWSTPTAAHPRPSATAITVELPSKRPGGLKAVAGGSVLIELGWPAKALSPNSREHFMTKWRYAKASKDTAFWATRASLGHSKLEHDGKTRIAVVITAYPPDKRDRDSDNLLASCKACLDGIALALRRQRQLFRSSRPVGRARA